MARILVADDDEAVRSAIQRTLEALGHEVEQAADGSEVLRLQRERPSDLLLIDLYMPRMDGVETIIRLTAEQPETRIVALSGGGFRDKHDVLAMALEAGACAALAKPFEREDLLATVTQALTRDDQARRADAGPGRDGAARAKPTVLLVDDDEQTRLVLRKRLQFAGFAVIEAANADSALRKFRAHPTDVVVTDLILPGTSGAQLIARLRAGTPPAGILAISGAPERLAELNQQFGGKDGFRTLEKPFTTPQFLEAIEAVRHEAKPPEPKGSWFRVVLRILRRRY